MANTIQVRRGANASLPTLNAGEIGFSTDTYDVYIGDGAANHELAQVSLSQTLTNKTIELDDALSGDHTYEGITTDDTVGESVVFGDLLYMKSDSKWWKGSSAVASSAECPIEAMAVATIAADAAGKLLFYGTVYDATFNFTNLGKVYVGVDVPTHTIPSTTGHTVQIIGTSLDANRMIFKPDSTYIELA